MNDLEAGNGVDGVVVMNNETDGGGSKRSILMETTVATSSSSAGTNHSSIDEILKPIRMNSNSLSMSCHSYSRSRTYNNNNSHKNHNNSKRRNTPRHPLRESLRTCTSTSYFDREEHEEMAVQMKSRRQARRLFFCISVIVFLVVSFAGVIIITLVANINEQRIRREAIGLAQKTGEYFSIQLYNAILPLFTLASFATELDIFRELPQQIGSAGAPGSLPFVKTTSTTTSYDNTTTTTTSSSHRNITGVCDQPELVEQFERIAKAAKKNAHADGILVNLQLAPQAVICLLYPRINAEDFDDGTVLDNTGALGLDLVTDPVMKKIAKETLVKSASNDTDGPELTVAGPLPLMQCPDCDPFFIARIAIEYQGNDIVVDGIPQPNQWGFATAIIHWKRLVEASGVYAQFRERQMQFSLTRTDRIYNADTSEYDEKIVVLAQTKGYPSRPNNDHFVSTTLETTNNMWEISIDYTESVSHWSLWAYALTLIFSAAMASLTYTVLKQKEIENRLNGTAFAQKAKVETERNMTAYFAHELRNPLSAIDSALKAMPDHLDQTASDLVKSMQSCTAFMSSIMNNLLDVRKLEENKMELKSEPLSLTQLVADVHQMLTPSVQPGVTFEYMCNTGTNDWVEGDFYRIQQVYINVVTNALKHTKTGSITLTIEWIEEETFFRFQCVDTGPGIPKKDQERMFERFTQRGSAPGTGLGLYISKKLLSLMNGTIRFESDPDVRPGTNCIVDISLPTCDEPPSASFHPDDYEQVAPIQENITILIVDDVKINRAMLKRRIQKSIAPNSTVFQASTGEEAIAMCSRGGSFDVIITDQYMETAGGVLEGTDAVRELRKLKVDSLIIGNSGNDLEANFFEAGADLFWKKPLPTNDEMIAQLRKGLEIKSA